MILMIKLSWDNVTKIDYLTDFCRQDKIYVKYDQNDVTCGLLENNF